PGAMTEPRPSKPLGCRSNTEVPLWTKAEGIRRPPAACNPTADNSAIRDVTRATAGVAKPPAPTNDVIQDDVRCHGFNRTLNLKVTGSIPARPTLKAPTYGGRRRRWGLSPAAEQFTLNPRRADLRDGLRLSTSLRASSSASHEATGCWDRRPWGCR